VTDPRRRRRAVGGILAGLLLSALDSTLVSTALPAILEDLDGFTLYFLPNAAFMLCQTVAMPIWGRLSDLHGRKRLHLAGLSLLVAGSVACALSSAMSGLVAARALQGLGAGGVMSLSFTMIADLYDLEERARMQGAISGVWGLAALMGPVLGGALTRTFGWPSIFWINLPLGVLSAALVQPAWTDSAPRAGGRADWPGAVLLAAASACLLGAFGVAGREGWSDPGVLWSFGGAAVLVVVLVAVERRRSDPFLAYDLYRLRIFWTGAATGVCAMICMFCTILHVPLLVAGVIGRSLETGGLMLTCMMTPWMVCSGLTRVLLKRFSIRALAAAGMGFAGAAYLLLAGLEWTLGSLIGAMALLGTGLGLTVAPLLIVVQNAVPKDRLGAATSLTQFSRSMGAGLGLAVMGSLFLAPFGGREPQGILQFRTRLDPAQLAALVRPLAEGLVQVFRAGAVAAAAGLVLACLIPSGTAAELKRPAGSS
jgi:MFS family permease